MQFFHILSGTWRSSIYPEQQSRFIPDDNPRHQGETSFPPRSCTVSAGPGNRWWVRLTDSCRSLFPRIRGWCMRLSTSVVMRAHYICDLAAFQWNTFISVLNSLCFSSGPVQLSSEWVDLEWIVYQLLAFAIQPSSPQLRGKPNKHVAILKQYNIPCSFVLFCFSEQIKFVPGGTNLHLTQIMATFLFLLRFLFLWESAL